MYTCPFCKVVIEDGIDALVEHRKPGGECDTAYAALHPEFTEPA